jgi:hypothetical protein
MEIENLPGTEATGGQTEGVGTSATPPEEKTFTKTEVNDLMAKRVKRSHQSFFNRYGVKDLNELDDLVGRAGSYDSTKKNYDSLNEIYNSLNNQHKELNKKYAYKVGGIDENRIPDIEAYFKGRGIDIDENSLTEELKNHPEWIKKISTIQNMGAEITPPTQPDEKELASKIFGVKL